MGHIQKKKIVCALSPPFPSKLRCLLSPTGSLNSSTTLLRVVCESICLSCFLSLGIFCQEGCLCPSKRNYILTDDINHCLQLYIRNLVAMGFQMFTFLLIDYDKVLCFSANKLQLNSNVYAKEEYNP